MKPRYHEEKTHPTLQELQLTDAEIRTVGAFDGLDPEALQTLKETVFNLAMILLKQAAHGKT